MKEMKEMKETVQISGVCGVHPGYGENQGGAPEKFTATLQELSKKVFEERGIYCSFVVNSSKTIYHTEWGCPVGGEDTFSVSTLYNPAFPPPGANTPEEGAEMFTAAAIQVLEMLKEELKQSTLSVVVSPVEMLYLC